VAYADRERTGREDVAGRIRQAIVTGKLVAGERLAPERELAEQFGVSRLTVRDALRALEATGLIEVRVGARGGAFVTVPSGSIVGQTMSDMMRMSAVSPGDIVEARLIVELGTATPRCRSRPRPTSPCASTRKRSRSYRPESSVRRVHARERP
jgi:DNA-binding FadR family transcriptional regulator